jgi:hypothetical protein
MSTYHQHRQAWAAAEGEVVVEPACCRAYVVCLVAFSGEVVSKPRCAMLRDHQVDLILRSVVQRMWCGMCAVASVAPEDNSKQFRGSWPFVTAQERKTSTSHIRLTCREAQLYPISDYTSRVSTGRSSGDNLIFPSLHFLWRLWMEDHKCHGHYTNIPTWRSEERRPAAIALEC